MRKIRFEEILALDAYEAVRPRVRQEMIAYKKVRRVPLGDLVSVTFDNHRTLWFQIQEILRVERISAPEAVRDEVAVYNSLLGDGPTLSATLFIEIPDQSKIPEVLHRLLGVEDYVSLVVGEQRFPAQAEPGRTKEEKTSSVHYLTIPMGPDGARQLADHAGSVWLEVAHPTYRHRAKLSPATVAALVADLTEPEDGEPSSNPG
jgi:hypothetical protein